MGDRLGRDELARDIGRQVLHVETLGNGERHERLAVGHGQGRFQDADHLEIGLSDADRAPDGDSTVPGDRSTEDDHIVSLIGGRECPAGRVSIREIVTTGVGTGHETDHLIRKPELMRCVIDHRVDFAECDIDPVDLRRQSDERRGQREHPAATGLAADDDPIAEVGMRPGHEAVDLRRERAEDDERPDADGDARDRERRSQLSAGEISEKIHGFTPFIRSSVGLVE